MSDVELLINRMCFEFKKQIKNGSYGYTQRAMAYNSNHIEGSTLTKEQTSALFETQTLKTDNEFIRIKDIEETTGHFIMFNDMLKTYQDDLSEELIKQYHYDLKSGVFEDKANGYPVGEYKNRANIVSDIKTTMPKDVSSAMINLLSTYNSKENKSLSDLSEFHAKYENIHPFQDGNGRTGRIILFKECLKNNIFPFVIEDDYKANYYEALHKAQVEQNYTSLVDFFKFEQKRYYENVIEFIKDEEIDSDNSEIEM